MEWVHSYNPEPAWGYFWLPDTTLLELQINRSRVQIPAAARSSATLGKLFTRATDPGETGGLPTFYSTTNSP